MQKQLRLGMAVGAALLWASTAQAGLVWFNAFNPTAAPPATLGQYTMTPFGDDARTLFSLVSDVASPLGGEVGFSADLFHLETPAGGWTSWSNGYAGDVYFAGGTTLTLTLPAGTGAFYFFAEPNFPL